MRKHEIFEACVVTKLLYCLHTTWLNAAEAQKLDAFQARCLRKLTGTPHSYVSRVSNNTVRATAGAIRLSQQVRRQQLLYLGDVARMPSGSVIRDTIFQPNSFKLVKANRPRRRGRPRNTWAGQLFNEAISIAGREQCLSTGWSRTPSAKYLWRKLVTERCKTS